MSAFQCVRHTNAAEFLGRAESWLLRNEAENNLVLGVAAHLRAQPSSDAFLATVENDGEVVGCAFRTPPYKVSVTRMPDEGARVVGETVLRLFDDAPSVLGPESVASITAGVIAAHYGKHTRTGMPQRIYELRRVVFPEKLPSGKLRLAQPADMETVNSWLEDFARETNHGPADVRSYAQGHISKKTMFIWEDEGAPRTTALWAGMTPHGVRIGFVYTPPQFRGKGYASACVAGASQRALDSGYAFCCLYTDLSNATSNKIYQDIGYRPLADVVDVHVVD